MVRLLAVKTAIAVLSRAIRVSEQLRPRTWRLLAITQALLAVVCLWAYQSVENRVVIGAYATYYKTSTEIPYLTAQDNYGSVVTCESRDIRPGVCPITPMLEPAHGSFTMVSDGTGVINGTGFDLSDAHDSTFFNDTTIGYDWGDRDLTSQTSYFNAASASRLSNSRRWDLAIHTVYEMAGDRRFGARGDWFPSRQLPRLAPPAVLQLSDSDKEGGSLLGSLMKMALLFQAIILTIGSATSSVFLYLSYRRGQLDLKLKELQVREMEIKLENMERERARAVQEAAQSGIILLS